MKEQAATAANAVCGEEEPDRVMQETVEADYRMQGNFEANIHDKLWVNLDTGYVPRLETNMKSAGFESFVVQEIQPAPDLVIPTPE